MRKLALGLFAFTIMFSSTFMAAGYDIDNNKISTQSLSQNFSVKTNYRFNWNNSSSYLYASSDMKNYDADGFYGNALTRLYVANSEAVPLCSATDTKLEVNQNIECTVSANSGVDQYQSYGYYNSINGSTTTSDQVYTILS